MNDKQDKQNNLTEEQKAELYQKKIAKKGSHRNQYKNLLDGVKQTKNKDINSMIVFRFICLLKNWGIYTKQESEDFYSYFVKNRKSLIDKLDEFLKSEENQQKVKFAFQEAMKLIYNSPDLREKDYYLDFIDDLNMILGFTIKTPIFNLFKPNIYSKEAQEFISIFRYEFERAKSDKNYKMKSLRNVSFN